MGHGSSLASSFMDNYMNKGDGSWGSDHFGIIVRIDFPIFTEDSKNEVQLNSTTVSLSGRY